MPLIDPLRTSLCAMQQPQALIHNASIRVILFQRLTARSCPRPKRLLIYCEFAATGCITFFTMYEPTFRPISVPARVEKR